MCIRLKPITWAGYFIFANHIVLQYLMKYLTVGHYEIQGTGQSTTLHPESKRCNPTRSLSWYPGSKTIQHRIQNRTPWVKGQWHCSVLALWSYKIQSLCPLWEWLLLTNQLFLIYLILMKFFIETTSLWSFILLNATCVFSQELSNIHLLPRSYFLTR